MVKAYLRYSQVNVLNSLVGKSSNILLSDSGQWLFAAVNEIVNLISTKTGEIEKKFYHRKAEYGFVTSMALFNDKLLAIGYQKGVVLIIELESQDPYNAAIPEQAADYLQQFNAHLTGVFSLAFNDSGSMLVSGGLDTFICLYDLIDGRPLFKFVGHKESIIGSIFSGE